MASCFEFIREGLKPNQTIARGAKITIYICGPPRKNFMRAGEDATRAAVNAVTRTPSVMRL